MLYFDVPNMMVLSKVFVRVAIFFLKMAAISRERQPCPISMKIDIIYRII